MIFNVFALAAALIFSSASAKYNFGSRAARAQASALAAGGGYGSPYGLRGGGMSSAAAQAAAMGGGMGMGSGMASGMASTLGGSSMAAGMAASNGGAGMGAGMATSVGDMGMASSMASSMDGMGMASASASAVSMGGLQSRWNEAQSFCNDAMSRVANFIAKIEEVVLGLPLTVIKATMGIPSKVVEFALNIAYGILPYLERAKGLLTDFFRSVFELPAKALYGSISIFMDLITKILQWGQTCHGQPVCLMAPPHIGGYGPCGGKWPCTNVVGCQSSECFTTARALGSGGPHLDL